MLELVLLPDERLHKTSSDVREIDGALREYTREMITTMHEGNGIGLAGIQVGRMENLFVVHVPDDDPRVFINPKITSFSDELSPYEEGCLSIPGVFADVMRPDAVEVEAFDEQGKAFRLEADGILARVIQHEYDHLIGRLFYEYLKPGQQRRLLSAYEKARKQ
jgi:peptide deformylase